MHSLSFVGAHDDVVAGTTGDIHRAIGHTVAARHHGDAVITGTTVSHNRAILAAPVRLDLQHVVASTTEHLGVATRFGTQDVVTLTTVQQILSRSGRVNRSGIQRIVTGQALQPIILPWHPRQNIVTLGPLSHCHTGSINRIRRHKALLALF